MGGGRQAGRWRRRGQTERLRQTDIWIDGERKGEKIRKKMSDGILPLFPVGVGDERNEQSEVRGELKVRQREESR